MNGQLTHRHSRRCPFGEKMSEWFIYTVTHTKRQRDKATVILRCQSLDCRAQMETIIDLRLALRASAAEVSK